MKVPRGLPVVCLLGCLLVFPRLESFGQTQQFGVVPAQGQSAVSAQVVTGNGIEYHGGPVMRGPHDVYLIWYGNWSMNSATTILPDFIGSLGGSPYFNTNTTYGDTIGNVPNTVTMAGQFFDDYSQGTALSNQSLINIVGNAINIGALPIDLNGIYFILTSPDVDEQEPGLQFCSQICGFHTNASIFANDIKYAFVGNPDRCLATSNSCLEFNPSPNGNPAADAMASVMAHELNETVTDPDLNAWFHINLSGENGDLCNPFVVGFPPTFPVNGAQADIILGDRAYLIQSNFVNAPAPQGGCQMSFTSSPVNADYSLSATPSSQTAIQGGAPITYQVAINRTGGFTGAVSLNGAFPLTNAPSGIITVSFSPNPTTGNSSQATVTAFSSATPGSFSLIFQGVSGSLKRSTQVTLNVQSNGDFSLTPSANLILAPGTTNSSTLAINRFNGFGSAVSLSISGLPSGVTASFNPSSTTGNSSTMTLTAASNAAPGSFTVTITGVSGTFTRTASATLLISSVPSFWEAVHQIIAPPF